MKRLLFAIAVSSALLVSCTSSNKAAQEDANDFKAKIENTTNPDSIKMYIAQAEEYAKQLAAEGKVDEAKAMLEDLKSTVNQKDPSLMSAFTTTGIDDVVNAAVDTVAAAGAAVVNNATDAVTDKVEDVKAAATDKANSIKDAATEKANEIKDAVSQKADEVTTAAADAATSAADAAKEAATNAAASAKDKIKNALNKNK